MTLFTKHARQHSPCHTHICTFGRIYAVHQMFALLLDPRFHPLTSHPKVSQRCQGETSQLPPALSITDPQTFKDVQMVDFSLGSGRLGLHPHLLQLFVRKVAALFLLWSSRNVLWTTKLYLTFQPHGESRRWPNFNLWVSCSFKLRWSGKLKNECGVAAGKTNKPTYWFLMIRSHVDMLP